MPSLGPGHAVSISSGLVAVMLLLGLAAPPGFADGTPGAQGAGATTLSITSPAYGHEESIPTKYTCEGSDVTPPLSWAGLPPGTRSLALVIDDPDAPNPAAPRVTWIHWVLYNLPPEAAGLPEDAHRVGLPEGTLEGRNSWRRTGYGGPCPPIGRHRYFHRLYALDLLLPDLGEPTKARLEEAMEGHVLGRAEFFGTYEKGE